MRELTLTKPQKQRILNTLFDLMVHDNDDGKKIDPFVNFRKHVVEIDSINLLEDKFEDVKKLVVDKEKSDIIARLQSYVAPSQIGNSYVFISGVIYFLGDNSKLYPTIKIEINLEGKVTITSIEVDVKKRNVFSIFRRKLPYELR